MTTIAYRDGILAADCNSYRGSMRITDRKDKIIRLNDGSLLASAGAAAAAQPFAEWLNAGGDPDKRPSSGDASIFHLFWDAHNNRPQLRAYEDNGYNDLPLGFDFVACGSGQEYAMAAMEMGASAERAVLVAGKFDPWTGAGGVQVQVLALERPDPGVIGVSWR